jgi:hypothetical protein
MDRPKVLPFGFEGGGIAERDRDVHAPSGYRSAYLQVGARSSRRAATARRVCMSL